MISGAGSLLPSGSGVLLFSGSGSELLSGSGSELVSGSGSELVSGSGTDASFANFFAESNKLVQHAIFGDFCEVNLCSKCVRCLWKYLGLEYCRN